MIVYICVSIRYRNNDLKCQVNFVRTCVNVRDIAIDNCIKDVG